LSDGFCETGRMNRLLSMVSGRNREEVIAVFGSGRLVQLSRVRMELRGGTREDEIEARSWIALFMPETVLTGRSQGQAP
jgi:hypothetical protein